MIESFLLGAATWLWGWWSWFWGPSLGFAMMVLAPVWAPFALVLAVFCAVAPFALVADYRNELSRARERDAASLACRRLSAVHEVVSVAPVLGGSRADN